MKGFVAVPMTLNEYGYCWGNPLGYIDKNGLWPEWIEITGKVVTGIGLGLSVAALGMASAPAVAIAAGIVAATSLAGVIGGYMNEANGGSYLNGYAGAATGAAVQSGAMFLGGAPGCIVGGAASAWISSKMTDELDNADPTNSKYKTEEEINQSAKKNMVIGGILSFIPAFMMKAVGTPAAISVLLEEETIKGLATKIASIEVANTVVVTDLANYTSRMGSMMTLCFGGITSALAGNISGGDMDEEKN